MKDRILSVDIFRGATIVLMILVNTPGTWSNVFPPLLHAKWHGYTPTDLVFPFFLFIVGTSIVFAYQNKKTNSGTYKKISIRTLKLIGLGLFLGAFTISFPFLKEFSAIRFPGVLQRIGVVFFFAAIFFLNFRWKTLIVITVGLLVGYWLLMTLIPVNDIESTLDRAPNNLANWLDVKIFGSHNYKADYDPEGFLSTIPSIASSILGIFTGLILLSKQKKKATILFGLGGVLLIVGHLWDLVFPINKALWTSSFVLVTAGWANIVLALIYYLTDIKKIQFGSIFRYAGANAIVVYFLSSFISKIMGQIKIGDTSLHGWLFQNIYVQNFMSMELSSLLYGLSVVAFYCLLAYVLYKKKIFIKV
ncbi:acyltransferase family protein [Croceitalea rosinachiae]|uniref:Heparan-alpha-glucosaminide N-acetyltransferase domain-containing protein n=1 Tax=Croceitalea rosinachiae TaxID=3075596 RepID=A0ABU3A8Y6_9FLAO|nr:heparan-alpha-glucosaminide N-acetyltransferase domain-containing protein [Croceitalea sp. F388]MDT0606345.1 heparan-alpha-glucosaminide N-acetyltransferase domain-containing protein [Croceitalea sp. F388]